MARSTTKVLAGVAVAALAAAAVATVVSYRRGQIPDLEQQAYLDELDTRLEAAGRPNSDARSGRILDGLQRNHGISVKRLRSWITGVRRGTLSPEQATVAESDFDALERDADQGGV